MRKARAKPTSLTATRLIVAPVMVKLAVLGRRLFVVLIAASVSLGAAVAAASDTDSVRINHVKAAFILNIARFVTWPGNIGGAAKQPLVFCYFKKPFLGAAGRILTDNRVDGHPVSLGVVQTIQESHDCAVLIVDGDDVSALMSAGDDPVPTTLVIIDLTSDGQSHSAYTDVHINLVREKSAISFEVNMDAVNQADFKVSSKLLKLARIIGSGDQ